MSRIRIDLLWPGEAVLSKETVEKIVRSLTRGEQIQPVEVYEVNGQSIVRDGNNRVHSLIEYYRDNNAELEYVQCKVSQATPPGPASLDGLLRVASYYGKGPKGFLRIFPCFVSIAVLRSFSLGGGQMESITINLLDRLASELKEAANKIGLSMEDFIKSGLEEKLSLLDRDFQNAVERVLKKTPSCTSVSHDPLLNRRYSE